jgi:hypothetical protein
VRAFVVVPRFRGREAAPRYASSDAFDVVVLWSERGASRRSGQQQILPVFRQLSDPRTWGVALGLPALFAGSVIARLFSVTELLHDPIHHKETPATTTTDQPQLPTHTRRRRAHTKRMTWGEQHTKFS